MSKVTLNWNSFNLFNSASENELKQTIDEAFVIYNKNLDICKGIEMDQLQYALEKKNACVILTLFIRYLVR